MPYYIYKHPRLSREIAALIPDTTFETPEEAAAVRDALPMPKWAWFVASGLMEDGGVYDRTLGDYPGDGEFRAPIQADFAPIYKSAAAQEIDKVAAECGVATGILSHDGHALTCVLTRPGEDQKLYDLVGQAGYRYNYRPSR